MLYMFGILPLSYINLPTSRTLSYNFLATFISPKLKYRVANVLRLASASSKIQTNPPAWSLSTFPWRISKTVELVEIWGSLITTAKSYSLRLRQCGAFSAICMLQACASHRLAPRSTIHSARLTTVWGENTLANFPFQVGCAPFLRLLT
jgi:hypothetical protein